MLMSTTLLIGIFIENTYKYKKNYILLNKINYNTRDDPTSMGNVVLVNVPVLIRLKSD